MRGLRSAASVLLSLSFPLTILHAQQDPPREDCCVHLYNVAINLGWASSLLNHVIVPGEADPGARAAAIADLRRAADHVTAARRACSEINPVWQASPDHEQWLRRQAGRLEGTARIAATDREVASLVRETYQWAEQLGTGVIGMPPDRAALGTPSCDVGYFRLGWLFGYSTQTLRLARGRRDQGRQDWTALVEDARGYLRTAVAALDQYEVAPNHANIDGANPYGRLSRMIAAPAQFVDSMEADADSLWTITQRAIATDCAILPGRIDAPPTAGYCILRRADLYQPDPGPPRCFEFYLGDASVQDASRMVSIGAGGCGATYFAWRQGWRPDPSYGGPFSTWREADMAMTILSRYGRNFYGCGQQAPVPPDTQPGPPPPDGHRPPPDRPQPTGLLVSVNGGLDPQVVADKIAGYDRANFTATFESTPVNLEIDATGRATVNQQLRFHMSSYNRGIQVLDEVEFTYMLSSGTGTVERASGQSTFRQVMKSNGRVTRDVSGTLPWSAERQPDGSYKFSIENGIGGWYAPIPYILR